MARRFARAIEECLRQVPRGRVATCAAVATALGDVRAARAVATWIRGHADATGAHRVVRADGSPVLEGARRRIVAEAIPLRGGRVPATRFVPRLDEIGLLVRIREEQERLARQVRDEDEGGAIRVVAGVDVAYEGDRAHAAAVAWSLEDRSPTEIAAVTVDAEFPYIPTYLASREFPAIRAALGRLGSEPDAILIDGHGRMHPARCGVASFAGVKLRRRTIGVAKRPLIGRLRSEGRSTDGVPIEVEGEICGYAWTPPEASRPVYISVGHRVSLPTAARVVREATVGPSPEPLRLADRIARKRKGVEKREKGLGS